MKKKLVSALALMMSCVMLAACGGKTVDQNPSSETVKETEAADTESTEEAEKHRSSNSNRSDRGESGSLEGTYCNGNGELRVILTTEIPEQTSILSQSQQHRCR